jgi:uracil-DNA glycosylase
MIYVPSVGPASARIMVVGEAPGANEESEKRPFVGPAGKMLRAFLNKAGIEPDSVFYTNLAKYRPPGNKIEKWFEKGGIPNDIVILGLVELEEEIKRIRPNVIVAAGNFPMWALTGKGEWNEVADDSRARGYTGITKWRGSILPCTMVEGVKVIPTFHPSYINQEGYEDHGTWLVDLQRVKKESAFPDIRRPIKRFRIDPNFRVREDFRHEVQHRLGDPSAILTFDIEYIGNRLICVGMTLNKDEPVVIPTRTPSDVNYCREILTSGIGLNAQNSMFDCSVLEWWYQMPIIRNLRYDTMLSAHASNIELPKSLEYLCSIYTDQPYYKDMIDWKRVKKGQQRFEDVYEYNAIDTWTQHEIMEEQIKWDLTDPQARAVFEFEMQLLNPLWVISKRGIRVDTDAIKSLGKQLHDEQIAYGMILNESAGRLINVMSNKDVAWLLFQKLGLKPLKINKTGPACDDKTLAALLTKTQDDEQKTAITLVRDIRNRRSLISKFTDIELDDDGRLRGHYNPAGTDTGRLASKKFYPTGRGANQQNQPRDKRVRRVFLPDRGKKFGYADLERAESLVVAYITGDPEMLRVHQPGIDAHKELAVDLFHIGAPRDWALENISDDERYLAKKTRHAGNYMQGPQRFMTEVNKDANKTGVSIDFSEAKHFIQTYRSIHPFLQRWWHETEREVYDTSALVNLVGRKRVFYGCRRDANRGVANLPNAVAYVPQSTVGDVLNIGLLQLSGVACQYARKTGIVARIAQHAQTLVDGGFEMLQQIHDAIGFQYYEEHEEPVLNAIKELMRVPLINPRDSEEFEIPVEIQVGPTWGDCVKWHGPAAIAA